MPVNSADTAWLLISSALVMLMTPGVALFYTVEETVGLDISQHGERAYGGMLR